DVRCVPVVRGFVVGNRPAGFAETPVHDRVVGENHISVSRSALRGIFPEILWEWGKCASGTDISFTADRKSDCLVSFCSPKIGFPCPVIGGRVIFPETLKKVGEITTSTDIPFAANRESDCCADCCASFSSPEVGLLCPGIGGRIIFPEIL